MAKNVVLTVPTVVVQSLYTRMLSLLQLWKHFILFYLPPGSVLLSLANRVSTASSSVPWVFRASELSAQLKPISWNHADIKATNDYFISPTHTHTHRQVTLVHPKKSFSYETVSAQRKPMNQTFVFCHFHFCKASPTMRCSVCARFSSCAASALVLSSLRTSL